MGIGHRMVRFSPHLGAGIARGAHRHALSRPLANTFTHIPAGLCMCGAMCDVGQLVHDSLRVVRVADWTLRRVLRCHIMGHVARRRGRPLLRPWSCSRACWPNRCRRCSALVALCLWAASATPTSLSSRCWPRTRSLTSMWTLRQRFVHPAPVDPPPAGRHEGGADAAERRQAVECVEVGAHYLS